jgi:surface carbohydrate biosynthesis protein
MHVKTRKVPLIMPVENQVRELDPKLLLACIAVRRGFSVIIGSHREIDLRIASLPRSLYLNKSMTDRNLAMFRIMRNVGHEILTWDEEALVHLPPETYYSRRLSPVAIRYVSQLFAWGEDNAELWRQYPHLPKDMPIHVTGNPRSDMLRPELQSFYNEEIKKLRKSYGKFILVNTNFNHVNAFFPAQNLFKPIKKSCDVPAFGKAAVGMSRAYAEGLRDHKQTIFDAFKHLIPLLDREFKGYAIVVRPHPTENQAVYQSIAQHCQRVTVTNEGNVVPWLMATEAVIHNGCTTGVEAYMLRVPAISYRAAVNEDYDLGFYRLPNLLSHQCFSSEQLQEMVKKILKGEFGVADGDERRALAKKYLAARDGPLACERIVDVLDRITEHRPHLPAPDWGRQIMGWSMANGRRLIRHMRKYLPGRYAPPEFHRHRYPGISLHELGERIFHFHKVLGYRSRVKTEQLTDHIFVINPE